MKESSRAGITAEAEIDVTAISNETDDGKIVETTSKPKTTPKPRRKKETVSDENVPNKRTRKPSVVKIPEWLNVLPEYVFADKHSSKEVGLSGSVVQLLDTDRLIIQIPSDGFNQSTLENLSLLIASKASLIKKAVGADDLTVYRAKTLLCFPWFSAISSTEEIEAYSHLICTLCDMAKRQKRVLATEKPVDNEKYAFRCFLLRLGMIGDEYATARRILLRNMSGNGSTKSGEAKRAPRKDALSTFDPQSEKSNHADTVHEPQVEGQDSPKRSFSLKDLFRKKKV